jgi:hypothetical protein
MPNCNKEISYQIITHCVSKNTMEKYDLFKLRKVESISKDEIFF